MPATFVLSTGRCGTQSLAALLRYLLGPRAVVEHEPIGAAYAPRLTLGLHPFTWPLSRFPKAGAHHERVCELAASETDYVETGWPSFSWLPFYSATLGDAFRYIHLVRNPIHVAASLVGHKFYNPKRTDEYAKVAMLTPFDSSVVHGAFASKWQDFCAFEKCLFQWLEINSFACRLEERNLVPVARVKFENIMTCPRDRQQLLHDLGWQFTVPDMPRVDKWPLPSTEQLVVRDRELWRQVEELAEGLGYSSADLSAAASVLDR